MAVAAAIGVGEGEEDVMSQRLASATSRLSGKRSLLRSAGMSQQAVGSRQAAAAATTGSAGLSEINRSIEKMTLQPMNNGGLEPKPSSSHSGSCKTTSQRRDSDWTSVSTEDPGYGSLRSDLNNSRRGSELSTVSQVCIRQVTSEKGFDG